MKTSVLIWSMTLLASPVGAQEHTPQAHTPAAPAVVAAKPAQATTKPAPKPTAAKPAISRATSAESAAERIQRRLDQEFPKTGAAPTRAIARGAGTSSGAHASERLTLTWRIALQWPVEITSNQIK